MAVVVRNQQVKLLGCLAPTVRRVVPGENVAAMGPVRAAVVVCACREELHPVMHSTKGSWWRAPAPGRAAPSDLNVSASARSPAASASGHLSPLLPVRPHARPGEKGRECQVTPAVRSNMLFGRPNRLRAYRRHRSGPVVFCNESNLAQVGTQRRGAADWVAVGRTDE
jgi:hypothetical protein